MTTDRIPALTLRRPWPACFLLPVAPKRAENRTWKTSYRGPVFLHGGRRWEPAAIDLAVQILHDEVGLLMGRGLMPLLSRDKADHPVGLVAVADLVGICSASADSDQLACDCGPWGFPGQHHWLFDNARPLAEPVPCPGRLSLWYPDPADAAKARLEVTA